MEYEAYIKTNEGKTFSLNVHSEDHLFEKLKFAQRTTGYLRVCDNYKRHGWINVNTILRIWIEELY